MKLAKSLLLGTAAGFAAVAGAQAADLPSRKAAPVEYVKVCDAYGAGFFYIPGTDTCLRVSGRVRADYLYASASSVRGIGPNQFPVNMTTAAGVGPLIFANGTKTTQILPSFQTPSSSLDSTGFLARGVLILDARTQTPWGTARTFIGARAEHKTGLWADNYSAGTLTGQTGAASITVENAFVQFAGFTFGRAAENFGFMPAWNLNSYAWSSFPAGINQLTYTATFGGGFSATISLEDRQGMSYSVIPNGLGVFGLGGAPGGLFMFPAIGPGASPFGLPQLVGGVLVPSVASGITRVANGPSTWPALVGNLRLDQSWGAVQVMGSVLQNSAVITSTSLLIGPGFPGQQLINPAPGTFDPTINANGNSGPVQTKIGWTIGAGLKINLPMLAPGDVLHLTAAYSDGDLDHINGTNTSGSLANAGRELGGLLRTDRNLTVFPTAWCNPPAGSPGGSNAAVCAVGKESTKGWEIGGIFTHYWTPTIRQNVIGSYLSITPGTMTRNTDWQFGGLSKAQEYRIGTAVIWSPAKDFDIGVEVTYAKLNQSLATFPGFAPSNAFLNSGGGLSPVLPVKTSPSAVISRLRVERTF